MTESTTIAALATAFVALIGVVWSLLRGEISETKGRVLALEKENARLVTDHARSEERDKAFEANITKLTKAIDDFDARIGRQIEELTRAVQGAKRSISPPDGTYRYKFIDPPAEGHGEKK